MLWLVLVYTMNTKRYSDSTALSLCNRETFILWESHSFLNDYEGLRYSNSQSLLRVDTKIVSFFPKNEETGKLRDLLTVKKQICGRVKSRKTSHYL